jgi:colanic acid/amylovoran biosynthesis glycosyltransferase
MSTFTTTSESVSRGGRITKPRLAYIVSLFPCWSETFIAEEIQHLLDDQFRITIFSLKPPTEKDVHSLAQALLGYTVYPSFAWRLLGAQFHYLWRKPRAYLGCLRTLASRTGPSFSQFARFMATFAIAVYFSREVEGRSIERIHAHWATYPATAAWVISRLTGLPYSFTTHAHDLFLPDALLPEKLKSVEFVVTISEFNRHLLESMGAQPEKIVVVHCGVDTTLFRPQIQSVTATPFILAVGRLVSIKGFDVLIDACQLLKSHGLEFRCEIIGDGPLRAELADRIARNGLDDCVRLAGFAKQDDVRRKLEEASIFVLPSRETKTGDRDGIPVAIMEAMAMQVPVVSTSVSGIPELIDNEVCGLLVDAENPGQIAAAISHLLGSPAKRQAMAEAGRTKVLEQFDVAKNAATLGSLFVGPS